MKVYNYGLKKDFLDRYDVNEVLKENRLTAEQIVNDVLQKAEINNKPCENRHNMVKYNILELILHSGQNSGLMEGAVSYVE